MNLKAKLAGLFAANGMYWLAVLIMLLGVSYCSAAGFLLLAAQVGNAWAALLTGLALLGLVLVPIVVAALRLKHNRSQRKDSPIQGLLNGLLEDQSIEELIKGNSKTAVLAALAAGVLAGASPEARQGLMRLLEEFADKE